MRLFRSMIALLLLGTAACAFALPRTDLPETAFNETDTPVNVTPPMVPAVSIVRPAGEAIAILPAPARHESYPVGWVIKARSVAAGCDRHSCHALLCTFLI